MVMDDGYWDTRYASADRLFSGRPNTALVAEAGGIAPGRALDVGCGEGADARWLAGRGWLVTAVDVSRVALERAAAEPAEGIAWLHADIAVTGPPAGSFDLVTMHYFPIERGRGDAAMRALLAAVAPGGTLLAVWHDLSRHSPYHRHNLDPADFYQFDDVRALLDDGWTVEVAEVRPREPNDTPHTHDVVLRARRAAGPR